MPHKKSVEEHAIDEARQIDVSNRPRSVPGQISPTSPVYLVTSNRCEQSAQVRSRANSTNITCVFGHHVAHCFELPGHEEEHAIDEAKAAIDSRPRPEPDGLSQNCYKYTTLYYILCILYIV